MSQAWKKLDLGGSGLQSMNASLTRQMRRRGPAYVLAALFPLGLHRFYLKEPVGGIAYIASGVLAAGLWLGGLGLWALVPLGAALAALVFDLAVWIESRVVAYNKALRMQQFLRPGATPPKDYRGRYTDETELDDYIKTKERERAGHSSATSGTDTDQQKRAPSFAEQEAMLRALSRPDRGADDT
jgi:TM2 domain-containing membrane protein YozV